MKKRILLVMLSTLFFIGYYVNVYAEEPIPQTGTEQVTTMPDGNNGETIQETGTKQVTTMPNGNNGETIQETGTEQVTTMPYGNNGETIQETDVNGEKPQSITENDESNSSPEKNIVMDTGEVSEEEEEESPWVTTPNKSQTIYLVSVGIFVIAAYMFSLIVIFIKIKEIVEAYNEDKKVGE